MPHSYHDLLAMSPDELGKTDIALMNLLCAKGLPGAENVDISAALKRLDEWAAKVKFETERHLYRLTDPKYAEHYKHSEARLRSEFIVQVLQEDCGVHYNMERVRNVDFSNPRDMFILGMIDDTNGGTCASMPVLYVAIGRRLGYPMKLALAREHVYCRWEGESERLNMDGASNGGLDFPDDAYYRGWPKPIGDELMKSGEFLHGLSPQEELSAFMLNRGCVYHARGMLADAIACFAESHRLFPGAISPQAGLATAMAGRPMPGQEVQVANTRDQRVPPRAIRHFDADDPTPKTPGTAGWTPPPNPRPPKP